MTTRPFDIKTDYDDPEQHPELYDTTHPDHQFAVDEYNYNASIADDTNILLGDLNLVEEIPGTIPPQVREDNSRKK